MPCGGIYHAGIEHNLSLLEGGVAVGPCRTTVPPPVAVMETKRILMIVSPAVAMVEVSGVL